MWDESPRNCGKKIEDKNESREMREKKALSTSEITEEQKEEEHN